jgi:hypothetical protein
LKRRTESWNIEGWTLKQIRDQLNGIFRRKEIAIEEIHVTPQILEVKYYDRAEDNKSVNPSKRY